MSNSQEKRYQLKAIEKVTGRVGATLATFDVGATSMNHAITRVTSWYGREMLPFIAIVPNK